MPIDPQGRYYQQALGEQYAHYQHLPEQRYYEPRLPEQHLPEQHFSEQHFHEQQLYRPHEQYPYRPNISQSSAALYPHYVSTASQHYAYTQANQGDSDMYYEHQPLGTEQGRISSHHHRPAPHTSVDPQTQHESLDMGYHNARLHAEMELPHGRGGPAPFAYQNTEVFHAAAPSQFRPEGTAPTERITAETLDAHIASFQQGSQPDYDLAGGSGPYSATSGRESDDGEVESPSQFQVRQRQMTSKHSC